MPSQTFFSQAAIRCSTVQLSKEELCEFSGNKPVLKVQRKQIREIALAYGMPAKHPVIRILVSFALIFLGASPGFIPLASIALGEYTSFVSWFDMLAFAIPLMLIGLWPLPAVFQKRYYLLVRTVTGRKKLVFKERPSKSSLSQFLMKAEQEFGYKIKWSFGILKQITGTSVMSGSASSKQSSGKRGSILARPQRMTQGRFSFLMERRSKKKTGFLENLFRDFASG